MQTWQPTNPVERRLMKAHDDWMSFAINKQARVLYWQTSEADHPLVKAYFQALEDRPGAVIGLRSDFENARQYATDLAHELIAFYDAHREGSPAQGVTADWRAPDQAGETSTQYLLRLTNSLMKHHPDVFPAMVLVLEPGGIRDAAAFERWLDTLIADNAAPPWQSNRIRFVLHGTVDTPLPWLLQRRPGEVVIVRGDYHMQSVPRELVAASGERGPSGQFRRAFVELSETISRDDRARLDRLRQAALAVSEKEEWFDQSVVVHLLAGAALLKWQDHRAALSAYEDGTVSALKAHDAGHAAGNQLVVNTLFGEASVYLMQPDFLEAARRYERAAPYAKEGNDGILAVECWRMHGFCMEKAHREERALESGFKALDVGKLIDPSLRANSSLQLVAEWMLKHVGIFHKRRGELSEHLVSLYGRDWPDSIKPMPPDEVILSDDTVMGAT